MLRFPKKTKYKKQHKGSLPNFIINDVSSNVLNYGSIGLKAAEYGFINSRQLEAVRQCISKIIKKSGLLRMNVFPHTPVSKKPLEVRMGKGKGNVDHWVFKVRPGFVICEIETSSSILGRKALRLAQNRLPFKTVIISE